MENKNRERLLALEKDRIRKREEYSKIKSDPLKYMQLQNRQKLKYLKRKAENKELPIKKRSPTSQEQQRLSWRRNQALHRQKKKIIIVQTSETDSDEEGVAEDPLRIESDDDDDDDKLLRRQRYLYNKEKAKLLKQIEDLKKENKDLKVSQKEKTTAEEMDMTPNTKVDTLLADVDTERKEEIKKKLLFEEVVVKELKNSFKTTPKGEKRTFLDKVDKTLFKKYKLTEQLKKFTCRKQDSKKTDNKELIDKIVAFYEDDKNSKMAPGKKEFITRKKERKQKRYLLNSLKNLHAEFVKQNFSVSYSTFCKYRPFWVLYPQTDQRNTCMCKLHANVDLLLQALHKQNITEEKDHYEALKSILCDVNAELCTERTCEICSKNRIEYKEFQNNKEMTFYQWTTEKKTYEKDGADKTTLITTKRKFSDCPVFVINKLEDMMVGFMAHHRNICHQYESLKQLKNTLCSNEAAVHIDFSENYGLKFNEEIQAIHFGANRQQITLHTSVIYMCDENSGTLNAHSFCTISECNRHDAAAVWAHMIPIIQSVLAKNPIIDTIHIISDSPSSQYRNKYIFYILTQLCNDFPVLKMVTWNYQEAGHGKGAPDGIGAVLKRTADTLVGFGRDLDTFETFVDAIKKNTNIEIAEVTQTDIFTKENALPKSITSFRGTMKVHQVIWEKNADNVALRSLCCFQCPEAVKCTHKKHIGFLPNISGDRCQSISPLLSPYMCDPSSVWQSPFSLQLPSPSVLQQFSSQPYLTDHNSLSNHYSMQAKENEIDHTLLSVTGNSGETRPKTKKIEILSDITLNSNWPDTSFSNIQLTEADEYATDWHKSFESFLDNADLRSDQLQLPIPQHQPQSHTPPNQPQPPIPPNQTLFSQIQPQSPIPPNHPQSPIPLTRIQAHPPIPHKQPQSPIPQNQPQPLFSQIQTQPPIPQNQPQSLFSQIQTQPPIPQNKPQSLVSQHQPRSLFSQIQTQSPIPPNHPQSPIPLTQIQAHPPIPQKQPQSPNTQNQPQSLFSQIQTQPPIHQNQSQSLFSQIQTQTPIPQNQPQSLVSKHQPRSLFSQVQTQFPIQCNQLQSPIPQNQPQSLFSKAQPEQPTSQIQLQSMFSDIQPQAAPIIRNEPHPFISQNHPQSHIPKFCETTINPTLGDFVKVELTYDEDKKRPVQKEFVGQILAVSESKYTCKFLRPGNSKQEIFVFPPVDDVMDLSRSQIKAVLVPIQSKRGRFLFK